MVSLVNLSSKNVMNPICQANPITLWLMRLFGYDGLLPAVVFLLPATLSLLFNAWVIELTAVALPVMAFFYRSALGLDLIEQNRCRHLFRALQKTALFLGLIVLLLVDAFVILVWSIPVGAMKFGDYRITLLMYCLYLFLMAAASFPGLRKVGKVSEQSHTCVLEMD